MGVLINTYFVNGNRRCFTGSMMEQVTREDAEKFAEEEAERISSDLGLDRKVVHSGLHRIGDNIEVVVETR